MWPNTQLLENVLNVRRKKLGAEDMDVHYTILSIYLYIWNFPW